jgi:hypothetical protein
LEKCDNIKFKGDQLQDEHTPFVVRDFHHKDVASMSNPEMTPKPVLHSFMQLEARKTWPYTMP